MRRALTLLVVASALLTLAAPASGQVPAAGGFNLTSFCTPSEAYPDFRTFRVTNDTGAAKDVVLRNQTSGAELAVNAPPGASFWDVPAGPGSNTVILLVDGQQAAVKASNNNVCTALSGSATCDPAAARTTVTWTVKNNDTGPATISASNPAQAFSPNPVPANGTATATQVLDGPAAEQSLTQSVTLDLGRGVVTGATATLSLSPCQSPITPPLSFTFAKTASVATAAVGDTITYTYSGTNTSQVNIEVELLVDDRLGVLITRPEVTLVAPGESISESVTYTVRVQDAGTTIDNTAVVTVRNADTLGDEQQGVASASVVVAELLVPPDPPTSTPGSVAPGTIPATGRPEAPWLPAGAAATAIGAVLLVLGRSRRIHR